MDKAKLAELYLKLRKPILAFIGRQDLKKLGLNAEDVFQEVFVRCLRYRSEMVEGHEIGYLMKAAINYLAGEARRSRSVRAHDDINNWGDKLFSGEFSGEELILDAQMRMRIRVAFGQLPERRRQLIRMHHVEGMTYAEIGAELGLTYRTVMRQLVLAHKQLRNSFNQKFSDGTTLMDVLERGVVRKGPRAASTGTGRSK